MDPTIGLMHDLANKKRENLVFDLMEPLRAVVDREILELVRSETFSAKDFAITKDGVCRLNPQLARRLVLRVAQCVSCKEFVHLASQA